MKYLIDNWATIAGIFGIIGTPLAFIFGRRRAMAETQITRSDMIKSMQQAYDGWVDDDKQRYASLKSEMDEFKKEMVLQRKENFQQRDEIRTLRKSIEASIKREKEWEQKDVERRDDNGKL